MKIKLNIYVRIVGIALAICVFLLVLFPIKTGANTTLYAYNDGEISSITLDDEGIITQNFISTAYGMNSVVLNVNLKSNNQILGNILLELYDDEGVLISSVSKAVEGLSVTDNLIMSIPVQNQSYSREYQLVLKYTGTNGITFYTEKSNGKSNIVVNEEEKTENSLSISYFGKKKDYFFAWYPLVALILLILIFSLGESEGKNEKQIN